MSIRMRWISVRTLALALATWAAQGVQASPMPASIGYGTSGSIDSGGLTGPPAVSFQGVDDGTLTPGKPFQLGEFVITPPPAGTDSQYVETRFQITYNTKTFDGHAPWPNDAPAVLHGVLMGKVSSSGQSDLVALFSPMGHPTDPKYDRPGIFTPDFQTGGFVNSLVPVQATLSLVPAATDGGRFIVQGQLNLTPAVPEPASWMVFVAAGAMGIGIRRRRPKSSAKSPSSPAI